MKPYAPNTRLFLRSLREKPQPSGAATFLAFTDRSRVLPSFRIQPAEPLSSFEGQANLFASVLLALWVPVQPDERTNFLPHYQRIPSKNHSLSEVDLGESAGPVTQINPDLLTPLWAQAKTQNLGALLFLNCLMSRNFDRDTIGIMISPTTGNPFFTQKLSSFWFDFFQYPKDRYLLSHTLTDNLSYILDQFSQTNQDWWQGTGLYAKGNQSDENLLVYSAFECIFRVCLTPDSLIKYMIKTIFGENSNTYAFENHVTAKVNDVRCAITACFTPEQKTAWQTTIRTKGFYYFEAYQNVLSDFQLYPSAPLSQVILNQIRQEIRSCAALYGCATPKPFQTEPPSLTSNHSARKIMDDIQLLVIEEVEHEEEEEEEKDKEETIGAFILPSTKKNKPTTDASKRRQRSFSFFCESTEKTTSDADLINYLQHL